MSRGTRLCPEPSDAPLTSLRRTCPVPSVPRRSPMQSGFVGRTSTAPSAASSPVPLARKSAASVSPAPNCYWKQRTSICRQSPPNPATVEHRISPMFSRKAQAHLQRNGDAAKRIFMNGLPVREKSASMKKSSTESGCDMTISKGSRTCSRRGSAWFSKPSARRR